jgi:hypothetical protein
VTLQKYARWKKGNDVCEFITANQDLMLEFVSKKDTRERRFLDQYSL